MDSLAKVASGLLHGGKRCHVIYTHEALQVFADASLQPLVRQLRIHHATMVHFNDVITHANQSAHCANELMDLLLSLSLSFLHPGMLIDFYEMIIIIICMFPRQCVGKMKPKLLLLLCSRLCPLQRIIISRSVANCCVFFPVCRST